MERLLEVRVLGGLVAQVAGHNVHLGTPKQRAVFAMLALNPGHLVTVEQLVDELWSNAPPASATANVRTYAARLRRAIHASTRREILRRLPGGYRLELSPDQVDVLRFGAEVDRAQKLAADGAHHPAQELLRQANARWLGPMLPGVPLGPVLAARSAAAEERRLLALELAAELSLNLDQAGDAIPLLRELTAVQPFRESAQILRMRALRRHGDLLGALKVYQDVRQALREELGLEPGPELQALHRDTLAELSGVDGPRTPSAEDATVRSDAVPGKGASTRPPSVDWLPRPVTDFVGRRHLVERLLAETHRTGDRASPVHLIDGMAGSGKTTIAVQVARLLAERYPDAALLIDLAGHGRDDPVEPAAALVTLLRQLGVPSGRIPAELDYRIELWRRELSLRRAVVVLDNAASAEQVLPLLPTAPGAVVIITSRRRLSGLDLGPPYSLPVLEPAEGLALLAAAVGADRVAAEPEAADAVVRHCGYLPLAIRLAGARLAHRPSWRVADLADLLARDPTGIGHPALQDRTVVGAFATSYSALRAGTQRLFRLLSVFPGNRLSVHMAAAIAALPLSVTDEALDELMDWHLIEEVESGRYRMHDLIRQYSAELSAKDDTLEERQSALAELLDFILNATVRAAQLVEPDVVNEKLLVGPVRRPDLLDALDAPTVDWLEQERNELVALVKCARQAAQHGYAWRLARALWRFYYVRAYFDDIVTTHRDGLVAAESAADPQGVGVMHNYLASAYVRTGNYHAALQHMAAAAAIAERAGDRKSLYRYRGNIAVVHWFRGELEEAVRVGMENLKDPQSYRPQGVPLDIINLALALVSLGRYEEALHFHRLHLFLGRASQNSFHVLNALAHIGQAKARMGRHASAVRLLKASLALRDRTGHRYGEPETRNDLGVALRGLGLLDQAVEQHEMANRLATDVGERHIQAAALNDLGLTLMRAGMPRRSLDAHRRALDVATRISHPYEQGRALAGLAGCAVESDVAQARRYWERALAVFRRMGVPERFEVERRLAELTEPAQPR
ncbi:BTAD domain-containing putative transcriptional regulator [Micromonospora sp. NPDC047707]|uniref:AfsR/SARP family transcriptional regulator n=1 Tax=Micromonospora sp. NPDC047707 TaxID=3154498 RepID=UPI0034522F66